MDASYLCRRCWNILQPVVVEIRFLQTSYAWNEGKKRGREGCKTEERGREREIEGKRQRKMGEGGDRRGKEGRRERRREKERERKKKEGKKEQVGRVRGRER